MSWRGDIGATDLWPKRRPQWAFSEPSVFRVGAVCDIDNQRSARLLEKAGFEREGVLRSWAVHPNISATPRDCYFYSKIRNI
jgi:ribosomal-protein-alanine N-acetyltransferase